MKKQFLDNGKDWLKWRSQFGDWQYFYCNNDTPASYPCVITWVSNCAIGVQYTFVYPNDLQSFRLTITPAVKRVKSAVSKRKRDRKSAVKPPLHGRQSAWETPLR
jgi:hypothetical protein